HFVLGALAPALQLFLELPKLAGGGLLGLRQDVLATLLRRLDDAVRLLLGRVAYLLSLVTRASACLGRHPLGVVRHPSSLGLRRGPELRGRLLGPGLDVDRLLLGQAQDLLGTPPEFGPRRLAGGFERALHRDEIALKLGDRPVSLVESRLKGADACVDLLPVVPEENIGEGADRAAVVEKVQALVGFRHVLSSPPRRS